VLCLVQNETEEKFNVKVTAATPGGSSFMWGSDIDLCPGGRLSFVARIADRLTLSTPYATFRLVAENRRPTLWPREGQSQTCRYNADVAKYGGFPPWVLHCGLWSAAQQQCHVVSAARRGEGEDFDNTAVLSEYNNAEKSVASLLTSLEDCDLFSKRWISQTLAQNTRLPEECTLLVLHNDVFDDEKIAAHVSTHFDLAHFVIPAALFVNENCVEATTCDATAVELRSLGDDKVEIELRATATWPAMKLTGESLPYRTSSHWVVCYMLRLASIV